MRRECSLSRSRRRVTLKHRAAAPPGKAHEVGLLHASRQLTMRERVAQQVRMDRIAEPCVATAIADHLADPALAEAALPPEPQEWQGRRRVLGSGTDVAIEDCHGPCGHGDESLAPALAEDPQPAEVEIDVAPVLAGVVLEVSQLGEAN